MSAPTTVPIDPTLLDDLESRALEISNNLDNVLSHLRDQMFEVRLPFWSMRN